MALRTKLTERLGFRHPILLAPMGSTAGDKLAAAISAAGGLSVEPAGAILARIVAEAEAALARRFD